MWAKCPAKFCIVCWFNIIIKGKRSFQNSFSERQEPDHVVPIKSYLGNGLKLRIIPYWFLLLL